jgi:DNA-binding MarR family transcriptional regulator
VGNSNDERLSNLLAVTATGLSDAVTQAMNAAAGLDGTAPVALVSLLDFAPGWSIHQLSQVWGLTHSGAVRLVDRLADAGYVRRRAGLDARARSITLTRSGRAAALRVRSARATVTRQAYAGLTTDQREQLTALCEQLVRELTSQRREQRASGNPPTDGALCRSCDFAACERPRGRCPAQRSDQQHLSAPASGGRR